MILYIYFVINEKEMPKYKFRFNKKSVHLIINHNSESMIDLALKGYNLIKTSGVYTDEELLRIGNIPMRALQSMFKEIR